MVAVSPFVWLFRPGLLTWRLLAAGVAALSIGLLARWRARRPPFGLSLLVSLVAFVILSTLVCFADRAVGGMFPGPDALVGIRGGLLSGPRQILTSAVPAPSDGELLFVPFALAYWSVIAATEITWRTRTRVAAPAVAVFVFALALSFEATGSGARMLEAAAIAVLSLLYVVARNRSSSTVVREEAPSGSRSPLPARGLGIATVGVVAVVGVAMLAAAAVPVSSDRLALRNSVQPPLDPIDQINPLLLVNPVQLGLVASSGVLSVSSSDSSLKTARLPIARLDEYRCGTGGYRSTGRAVASDGELPSVGPDVPIETLAVRLEAADSRVLPTVGNVVAVSISDGRPVYVDARNRMVMVGSTPIDPIEYRIRTAVQPDVGGGSRFAVDNSTPPRTLTVCAASQGVDLNSIASAAGLLGGSSSDRLQALGRWCGQRGTDPQTKNADDLSLRRLFGEPEAGSRNVLDGGASAAQLVTACAVLGQAIGLPVQVAVGYHATGSGGSADATTQQLTAWLEVRDAGGLLHPVPIAFSPDPSASPQTETSPDAQKSGDQDVSPPPNDPSRFRPSSAAAVTSSPWTWLAAGVAAIAVIAGWFGSLGPRRRRRRRQGTPPQRLSGAWMEAVDTLGSVGVVADAFGPEDIARVADAFPGAAEPLRKLGSILSTTFAPEPPTAEQADDAWRAVDELRRGIRSKHTNSPAEDRLANSERGSGVEEPAESPQ